MLSAGRNLSSLFTRTQLKQWTNLSKVSQRLFSFQSDFIDVQTNTDTGIAVLKMHNRPVNCMGFQFLQDSTEALKGLELAGVKAVVITSSIPKIFCAGLDFNEIVKPKQERLQAYWKLFEEFIVTVYSSKLATVSAINGVAAAGGCVLALATDYRILLQQGSIGLNEVAIGLPLHSWIVQMTANVTGYRTAELVGLTGEILNSEKALKWGVVDEVAADTKELMEKAENKARIYARLPDISSWYTTKLEGRRQIIDLIKSRKLNEGVFLESINSASTQNVLSAYANKLKKK